MKHAILHCTGSAKGLTVGFSVFSWAISVVQRRVDNKMRDMTMNTKRIPSYLKILIFFVLIDSFDIH